MDRVQNSHRPGLRPFIRTQIRNVILQQSFHLLLSDQDATKRFGTTLAQAIEDRAVIALIGPLGAGKTTLVKSVASALGVTEVVNSPTFTMLNEYHSGRLPLYHMDLYRLSEEKTPAPLDLLLAEIDEFIHGSMVAMIEWAELFPGVEKKDETGSAPSVGYLAETDYLIVTLAPLSGSESDDPGLNKLSGADGEGVEQNARLSTVIPRGEQSLKLAEIIHDQLSDMLVLSNRMT
jgi:tRNA threonylcarbamoyladenosine biosynthesis protein TsaE